MKLAAVTSAKNEGLVKQKEAANNAERLAAAQVTKLKKTVVVQKLQLWKVRKAVAVTSKRNANLIKQKAAALKKINMATTVASIAVNRVKPLEIQREKLEMRLMKTKSKGATKERDLKKQTQPKNSVIGGLEQETVTLKTHIIGLEEQLDNLMKDRHKGTQLGMTELFKEVQKSERGGKRQYRIELVKMMLEMIATGAAPSTIASLVLIFAKTVEPDAEIEALPHLTYVQNLRTVLHTMGEALGVLQLSQFKNWEQLFTNATGIQRLPFQYLIITMTDPQDGLTKSCAWWRWNCAGEWRVCGGHTRLNQVNNPEQLEAP